jgi:AraC family transcriptional regulator
MTIKDREHARIPLSRKPIALSCGVFELTLLPAAAYEVRYTPDGPVIGFAYDLQSGVHAFASDCLQPFRTRPNSLAFVPAGCEILSQSVAGGEYLTVKVTQPGGIGFVDYRFNDHIDCRAIKAAQALRKMMLAETCESLLIEREITALMTAISLPGSSPEPAKAGRWMTPRRLRQVDGLIELALSDQLYVGDIAKKLGLSSGFFTRAFKAAAGKTPHDYIIDRRLARARSLIPASDMPLASVALACGFASQAHMTSQFRRRLGITPAALRARDEIDGRDT